MRFLVCLFVVGAAVAYAQEEDMEARQKSRKTWQALLEKKRNALKDIARIKSLDTRARNGYEDDRLNGTDNPLGVFAAALKLLSLLDGAEYDEHGNRVHQKRVQSYRPSLDEYGRPQMRMKRQNQGLRPQSIGKRQLRPVQKKEQKNRMRPAAAKSDRGQQFNRRVLKQETAASNRKVNIFNPNNQRPLRPVADPYYQSEQGVPSYPDIKRSDRPRSGYDSDNGFTYKQNKESYEPSDRNSYEPTATFEPVRQSQYVSNERSSYEPAEYDPVEPFLYESEEPVEVVKKPKRNIQRAPEAEQFYKQRTPEVAAATERFYKQPGQDKIYERSSQSAEGVDQLEGESFQPAYQPHNAPRNAYAADYAPPEQASIEAAVNAGAAGYTKENYEEPQRLSFQVHGQEGPNSYRFGYDTGIGYNRQFRYEERDNYGVLHGRYGYYDQAGKLQVVNYTADPVDGYHAEGEHVPKPNY